MCFGVKKILAGLGVTQATGVVEQCGTIKGTSFKASLLGVIGLAMIANLRGGILLLSPQHNC